MFYIIWNYSKVDTSSMKHFAQRHSAIKKYYLITSIFMVIDIFQIVMTFTVKLPVLVRVKNVDSRVEYYLKMNKESVVRSEFDRPESLQVDN